VSLIIVPDNKVHSAAGAWRQTGRRTRLVRRSAQRQRRRPLSTVALTAPYSIYLILVRWTLSGLLNILVRATLGL
jgi:hypothetical protein